MTSEAESAVGFLVLSGVGGAIWLMLKLLLPLRLKVSGIGPSHVLFRVGRWLTTAILVVAASCLVLALVQAARALT